MHIYIYIVYRQTDIHGMNNAVCFWFGSEIDLGELRNPKKGEREQMRWIRIYYPLLMEFLRHSLCVNLTQLNKFCWSCLYIVFDFSGDRRAVWCGSRLLEGAGRHRVRVDWADATARQSAFRLVVSIYIYTYIHHCFGFVKSAEIESWRKVSRKVRFLCSLVPN